MCGRYVITEDMWEEYEMIVRDFDPLMYLSLPRDIYPSAKAPAIISENKELYGRNMTFGFTGYEKGRSLINARRETALEKRTFADAVREHRCVLPAASFYEWNKQKEKAVFTLPEKKILYFAGCYRKEKDGNHFVILTGKANASMKPVHDRMPLILTREDIGPWLTDNSLIEAYLQSEEPMLEYTMDHEQMTLF